MKKYKKPYLEDEVIEIEDIINGSPLSVQESTDPNIDNDPGDTFPSGGF